MFRDGPRLGESELERQLRLRPFSFPLLIAQGLIFGGGVWLVIFYAQGVTERFVALLFALGINIASGVLVLHVVAREQKTPFRLKWRRLLWRSVILAYLFFAIDVVVLSLLAARTGFSLLQVLSLALKLIALLPLPLIASRFLKHEENG